MLKPHPLNALLTSATASMIALTACVLILIDRGSSGGMGRHAQLWPMILASSCATLLVMSLLHEELRRLYEAAAEREDQARIDARTDPLTGLGNRKFLFDELATRSSAGETAMTALMLMDLDNFKRVNDTRGHHTGDGLIKAVAARLPETVPDATLVRLGGDEFALLLEVSSEQQLSERCAALVAGFEAPFPVGDEECFARASVGASILQEGLGPSELLRRADIAMYQAKREGSGFKLFDRGMTDAIERRAQLSADLRECIVSGKGLAADFQGIFYPGGELAAVEALLRWKHPRLGFVPPQEIVEVAEETRLINDVGLVMATHACRAAQLLPDIAVTVNVSVFQLLDSRFPADLQRAATIFNVSPARIQIEVREQDFVERGRDITPALQELRDAGFPIAVDDFGSSTSSLPHLRKLGVSLLKLDRRILRNSREMANVAIMRAKVQLAHALGMTVVCEGVADLEDQAVALQSGCDMLQGFLLGAPQSIEDLKREVMKRRAA